MKTLRPALLAIALAFGFSHPFFTSAAESNLIVHEWGTFTSLQDERGKAIGGINTDDDIAFRTCSSFPQPRRRRYSSKAFPDVIRM